MALDAGKVVAVLELDTTAFSGGIKTAQSLMKQLQDRSLSLTGKISAVGKTMESVGKTMSKTLTLPIVAAGAAATAVFTSFDDSIRQVYATMGLTAESGAADMEALGQAAKDLGATTRYTAGEAASTLNYLALAGYDASKAIATLPTVLNLAQAGGIDLAQAANIVTDSMAALGIETEKVNGFVDEIARTSQKSNTSVAQLGEGILTIGATAKSLAGGTVELNTALGILADNGIKGAEGGTHLRNMMLSLQNPTKDASKALKRMGVDIYDSEGRLRALNEIFGDLNEAMDGWTDQKRTAMMSNLFNKTDLAAANVMLANYGERWDELSGHISNADGTAAQMAVTMEGGIGGSFRNLESAVEGLAIEFGENFAPTVQKAADFISDLVNGFSALSEETQTTIVNVAAVAAAFGPMVLILGKIVSAAGVLIPILTGPVGVVAACGIAVAALATFTREIDGFKESLDSVDPEIAAKFDSAFAEAKVTLDATVTDNATSTVNDAVMRLRSVLNSINILTDEERDAIVAGIGQDVDPILKAINNAGIDTSTEEGAAAGAPILAAATQLAAAIKLSEGAIRLLDAKSIAKLINSDKETIIKALVEKGAEPKEAETAAEQIIAARETLAEACDVTGIVPDDIVQIVLGEKSALVSALQGLGLTTDDIADIVAAYTTANQTLGASVGSVYKTIKDALTDGKEDTEEQKQELIDNVADYFEGLLARIKVSTDSKLVELQKQLDSGKISIEEYNTEVENIIAKNDELVANVESVMGASAQFVKEWSGKPTSACKAAMDELDAVADRAQQVSADIMAYIGEAEAAIDNLAYRKVVAGVSVEPEDVAEAYSAVRGTAEQQRQASEQAYQKTKEELGTKWDTERKAATEKGEDTTAIDAAYQEGMKRAEEERQAGELMADNILDSGIAAIQAGIASTLSPEIVARMQEMLAEINLADLMYEALQAQSLVEETGEGVFKGEDWFTPAVLQALGFKDTEFDPERLDYYLEAAGAKVREVYFGKMQDMEREFAAMDLGSLAVAFNEAMEAGFVDGIDTDDLGEVLTALLGNMSVAAPDMTGVGIEAGQQVVSGAESTLKGIIDAGQGFAQGFIDGMDDKLQAVINKAKQLARSAITAIERETDQQSPSKVAHRLGAFFGQGFEEGIYSKVTDVMAASAHMARASVNGLSDYRASTGGATRAAPAAAAMGGMAGGGSNMAVTLNVNNPVVRDGNDVARLSRDINRYTAQLARGYGGR
jgi:TP901 family phage tail tape measure protein